jgi:hypothetical protein
MPIPPIPEYSGITALEAGCGSIQVPLTLEAIIDAFDAADEETKNVARGRIVNMHALTGAIENSDDSEKGNVANLLKLISVFNANDAPDLVGQFLTVITEPNLATTIIQWLQKVFGLIEFHGEVHVATSGPCGVSVSYQTPNVVKIIVTLTPECQNGGGGMTGNITDYTFDLPYCEFQTPGELTVPMLSEVDSEGFVKSQGPLFQLLLNAIGALLKCCNPCAPSEFLPGGDLDNDGRIETPNEIFEMRMFIRSNPDPARIAWQPPEPSETGGVQRFGKISFFSESGHNGPMMFMDLDSKTFTPNVENCRGFSYFLNPGVQAHWSYRTREHFVSPFS